jgi:hypothetical protein
MATFNQQFTIHPVGQGLFYSCCIKHNNDVRFRMVFDCGSLTKGAGEEEVKIYRDSDYLDEKVLDLLVISHFDADHVKFIGKLLEGGIKVRKLVMPFITFNERLFLIARYLDNNDGFNPNDDFFVRFTIDPLGTLNNNLDGDSEVFLIERGPLDPILPEKEVSPEITESDNNETRFRFDFENANKVNVDADSIMTKQPKSKISKINDSEKGKLFTSSSIILMEFLFYKRTIGEDEVKFYEKVKELFFKKFLIDDRLSKDDLLDEIVNKVKDIEAGTEIKKIFRDAKDKVHFKTVKGVKIDDLNTTALCMMHRNLSGIFNFLGYPARIRRHTYFLLDEVAISGVTHIQKFISPDGSRIETQNYFNKYPYPEYYYNNDSDKFIYPNALLTSDSFLLTQAQVSEFVNHFINYWNDYWLFQIPHHGSQRSSDSVLHSAIQSRSNNFINYGIGNRDHHPNASVIQSLVATGNSVRLIPINQFSGIRFNLLIG